MTQENFSLSFCPEKDFQGIGEKEFSALVNAEKAVADALEAVVTSREKRENATTTFLKKIGAYTKAGKPTKAAMESGPVFVTSWIMQFFHTWPEVKRPGREAEPAAIGNEAVKGLFTSDEHKALTRSYNALASAISAAKKPAKPAAQEQDKPTAPAAPAKPAAQEQDKPAAPAKPAKPAAPAAQGQDKPAEQAKPGIAKAAALIQKESDLNWFRKIVEEAFTKKNPKAFLIYAIETEASEAEQAKPETEASEAEQAKPETEASEAEQAKPAPKRQSRQRKAA